MFESCHSPHEVAQLLRLRYGLPVELFAGRPYVTCGRSIEAIATPAEMGRWIRTALRRQPAVPVIADPRNQRWIFLVAPPQPYHGVEQRFHRPLLRHGVLPLPIGRRVLLPASDYPLGWHWADEPVAGRLRMPERTTVLSAVRLAIREGAADVSA